MERVGGQGMHRVDIRIVAATNRSLRSLVNDGLFRADLFYRLSGVEVHVPPLRQRQSDVHRARALLPRTSPHDTPAGPGARGRRRAVDISVAGQCSGTAARDRERDLSGAGANASAWTTSRRACGKTTKPFCCHPSLETTRSEPGRVDMPVWSGIGAGRTSERHVGRSESAITRWMRTCATSRVRQLGQSGARVGGRPAAPGAGEAIAAARRSLAMLPQGNTLIGSRSYRDSRSVHQRVRQLRPRFHHDRIAHDDARWRGGGLGESRRHHCQKSGVCRWAVSRADGGRA